MSQTRQINKASDPEKEFLVRTLALNYSAGNTVLAHTHPWAQLIYAQNGVMDVHTATASWIVPPQRAVWVPAGLEHRIAMSGRVELRTLYLRERFVHGLPPGCCAVNISPLLRELILHIVETGMLQRKVSKHRRLHGVLLDQLKTLTTIPLRLPMPEDSRARRAAETLRAEQGTSIEQVARRVGASRRTLERLFRAETGMPLGRWRQQARLLEAMRLLAAAEPVTQVALAVGYESPSAFIAMFRRTLGTTPSQFIVAPGDPS